jgi:hypothetical protein
LTTFDPLLMTTEVEVASEVVVVVVLVVVVHAGGTVDAVVGVTIPVDVVVEVVAAGNGDAGMDEAGGLEGAGGFEGAGGAEAVTGVVGGADAEDRPVAVVGVAFTHST